MESKGIIRRMDELGRIVIPREYRKLYGIETNDPIEICAFEDGVIRLKKVDTSGNLVKSATKILGLLSITLNATALLCDGKTYIDGYGKRRNEFIGKSVEKSVAKIIKERSKTTLNFGQSELCLSGEVAVINSIHARGELYGGLIVIANQSDTSVVAVSEFCALMMAQTAQSY